MLHGIVTATDAIRAYPDEHPSEALAKLGSNMRSIAIDLTLKEQEQGRAIIGNLFVIMVGLNSAGKETTIMNHSLLRRMFRASTDKIHPRINREFEVLRDGYKVTGDAYELRQAMTCEVRLMMLEEAMLKGLSVVSDSSNVVRTWRTKLIQLARLHGHTPVIVDIRVSPEEHRRRLKERDAAKIAKGNDPVWVELHEKVMSKRYEEPSPSEVDPGCYFWFMAESGFPPPDEAIILPGM